MAWYRCEACGPHGAIDELARVTECRPVQAGELPDKLVIVARQQQSGCRLGQILATKQPERPACHDGLRVHERRGSLMPSHQLQGHLQYLERARGPVPLSAACSD